MRSRVELEWSVGFCRGAGQEPERRVPARVPGAVQLDWASAERWEPWWRGNNWRQYRWMEDVFWSYKTRLTYDRLPVGRRLFFVCRGVDYRFQVLHRGSVFHDQEGMFTPFEIDLTGRVEPGDDLEILIWPAPKSIPDPEEDFGRYGRTQTNQSCKPGVSYGWDFHPRLVPLGIWDKTYLEIRPALHLSNAEVSYSLSQDFRETRLSLSANLSRPGSGIIRWRVCDPAGGQQLDLECPALTPEISLEARISNPTLWWPVGQGDPNLYRSVIELLTSRGTVVDRFESRIGFRSARLSMNSGAWDEPREFPKSRSVPPITLEVNGRPIFCKGSNWVNPNVFPGLLDEDIYKRQLDLVRDAGMNLLRLWGGAQVNKDVFFDLCDERGIMLWQEFPLACNRYEGTPGYLRTLDQESRSIIRRLRPHASLVIWCGGNELFNEWSKMTDQDLALRLLNRNCYDLDPSRPYLMTSPLMGMGHGHYVFRDPEGREVFQMFSGVSCTAYTEFGCPSPASEKTLRDTLPPEELFPPRPGTSWQTHHAYGVWQENSHLALDVIEDYFGPTPDLKALVERGQLLQGEGLKCLFEEARRQKPTASMALNWCFNEPWPAAANLSIVAWPSDPKPAYYSVKASLRPILASARIPRFRWRAGECFTAELCILNDLPESVPSGRIEARLDMSGTTHTLTVWDFAPLEPNRNLAGPAVELLLPDAATDRMELVLEWKEQPERSSRYLLLYRGNM